MALGWPIHLKSGLENPKNSRGKFLTVSATNCEELLRDEVLRGPSIFAQLMAVASLREGERDLYRHRLAQQFGLIEVDQALRRLHLAVFAKWLNFSVRQQRSDLDVYLTTSEADKRVISTLPELGRRLAPSGARLAEYDVFVQDLWLLAVVLRADSCQKECEREIVSHHSAELAER